MFPRSRRFFAIIAGLFVLNFALAFFTRRGVVVHVAPLFVFPVAFHEGGCSFGDLVDLQTVQMVRIDSLNRLV